jgi:hypothetical protein
VGEGLAAGEALALAEELEPILVPDHHQRLQDRRVFGRRAASSSNKERLPGWCSRM